MGVRRGADAGIERVAVVGGGVMGNGIAQVVATPGLDVTLVDIEEAALERARARIETSLGRFVKSEKLSPRRTPTRRSGGSLPRPISTPPARRPTT